MLLTTASKKLLPRKYDLQKFLNLHLFFHFRIKLQFFDNIRILPYQVKNIGIMDIGTTWTLESTKFKHVKRDELVIFVSTMKRKLLD